MIVSPSIRRTTRTLAITLGFIWLGCLIFVLLEQLSGFLTYRDFDIDPVQRLRGITLYIWMPWLVLAPCIALLSHRYEFLPRRWFLPLAAHIGLLLVLSLVHGLAVAYAYHYGPDVTAEMATYEPWQHSGHFLFGDGMFLFDATFYVVFAASLNIRNFLEIVRQQEIDAIRMNQSLAELRFQTLRMQINPHFLFNALNAISVLIRKRDTEGASEMISRLSRLFRKSLDESQGQWIALDDELDTVRQYLGIARVRFADRLTVREECEENVARVPVPSMLLQPLVENAVTHGLGERIGFCELSLRCRQLGDRLNIVIEDNGVGGRFYEDPGFKEGVGLANVRARLAQVYGDDHEFEIQSNPGKGTRIIIDVPVDPRTVISVAV
jgi:two-component system LytT family sensor kinase